jgi:RimJ/RimL family protein N-acetyltransferase
MTPRPQYAIAAARLPDRIETDRLVLRPPEPADIAALVAGVGNVNVARMLTWVPHPYGEGDARAWLAMAEAKRRAGTDFAYLIGHDDAVVGCIAIDGLETVPRLGYWLAEPAWGRGLATEAARALIGVFFDRLPADRLTSSVFADNPASRRVQEKLGFTISHRDETDCLARGCAVAHIHTVLSRARFDELTR